MGVDGWKNRAKMGKNQISLGLEGRFPQFVPYTLEHPLYTFLMTNLLLLSQNMPKIEKFSYVLDQFQSVPSTFSLPLFPQLWAKLVILLHYPISFRVKLD